MCMTLQFEEKKQSNFQTPAEILVSFTMMKHWLGNIQLIPQGAAGELEVNTWLLLHKIYTNSTNSRVK